MRQSVTDEKPSDRGGPVAKTVSRRGLLDMFGTAFLSLWGVGFIGAIIAYVKTPERRKLEKSGAVRAGALDRIPVGDAALVQHTEGPILVVRLSEREVLATSALCTHVRCVLKWDRDSRTIVCPCHGGAFDTSGNVLYGPPPRALQTYATEVRNSEVVVLL